MKLSNKQYDVLKWIAQILIPALGALYFGLSSIWNLPYPTEIVGTLTVIDTFLGAVLGVAVKVYNTASEPTDTQDDEEDRLD